MNKYQKALDDYVKIIAKLKYTFEEDKYLELIENLMLLQELVDKETPIKPDRDRGFPECSCGVGFHGKVENEVSDGLTINYCFSCGQALDWRKDE